MTKDFGAIREGSRARVAAISEQLGGNDEQNAMMGHFHVLLALLAEHKSSMVGHMGECDAAGAAISERMAASASLRETLDSYQRGAKIDLPAPDEVRGKLEDLSAWMNANPIESQNGFGHASPLQERFAHAFAKATKFGFFDKLSTYEGYVQRAASVG